MLTWLLFSLLLLLLLQLFIFCWKSFDSFWNITLLSAFFSFVCLSSLELVVSISLWSSAATIYTFCCCCCCCRCKDGRDKLIIIVTFFLANGGCINLNTLLSVVCKRFQLYDKVRRDKVELVQTSPSGLLCWRCYCFIKEIISTLWANISMNYSCSSSF